MLSVGVHLLDMTGEVGSFRKLFTADIACMWSFLPMNRINMRCKIVAFPESSSTILAFIGLDFFMNGFNMLCQMTLLRERATTKLTLKVLPPGTCLTVVHVGVIVMTRCMEGATLVVT